jgi:serine/threonine-protein kinase
MSVIADRLNIALADRYRIERELGAGGMATVYLAEDLKHDRKVALKVLKPELAAVLGAERFVVEIKTTAALQHPHILPLFDSGAGAGFLYYVMPYIKGETIREKLNRESQCGVEESVRIAREIADALDYAHRNGIIHRDIKPENILLHDGRAMVMDFGIALAVSAAAGGRMTETGLSLGTPHYMSPEQATAEKEISPRSDVYSLASVLYEMLAGEPPHTGGTAQAVIMKIITDTARPVNEIRKNVPPHVVAALAKALEKLPADRFESAKSFADALGNAAYTSPGAMHASVARVSLSSRTARFALIGGGVLALIGIALSTWALRRSEPPAPALPLVLELPNGAPDLLHLAVSRDGTRFAFGTDAGIAIRDAGQRDYHVIPGSQNGESPAFSWDGEWVAFTIRGHLRKANVRGGAAVSVIPSDSVAAGMVDWGPKSDLVIEARDGLYYLPAGSGVPKPLRNSASAQAPRFTPDGKGLLYFSTHDGGRVMYYDLSRDTAYAVLDEAAGAQLLANGWLVYTQSAGGLFAVRFDASTHRTSGNPVPVVGDFQPTAGAAPFFVTDAGTLVYRSGVDPTTRLLVRDARGKLDTLPVAPQRFAYARYSPDGKKIALTVGGARTVARYTSIFDITLGTMTQFTVDGGGHAPVWSPDGKRLAFTAEGRDTDAEDLFVRPIDKSKPPVRLLKLPNDQHATSWPVDTMLLFSSQAPPLGLGSRASAITRRDAVPNVAIMNPNVPDKMRPFLQAEWLEGGAVISPDLHWAAYESAEAGTSEVMVRPFPGGASSGQWKVSAGGGQRPRWSGDGRTVFYQTLDGKSIKSVRVNPGTPFTASAPTEVLTLQGLSQAWDVDRTSGNLLVSQAIGDDAVKIVVIQHWLADFLRSRK